MRPRITRSARLNAEALESRNLMAAGGLGTNVAPEYINIMNEVRDFGDVPGFFYDSGKDTKVTLDSRGWPTSDASLVALDQRVNQSWNGPDPNAVAPNLSGTYHISFQGSAQIRDWGSNFVVQNQVYNTATNTTTADLVENQVGGNAFLGFYFLDTKNPASSTGAGITDIKLIRPGYDLDTTQVFTTRSINSMAGFDTIRPYDALDISSYSVASGASSVPALQWSQRRLPTDPSQTSSASGKIGQSYEYMVRLANDTNTNLWLNIPGAASDDYVRQLASLVHNGDTVNGVYYAGLKPGLKVYVEYSNEVWGGLYNPWNLNQALTRQAIAAGDTSLNGDGTTDMGVLDFRYYAKRATQVSQLFRDAYGVTSTVDTVRPVLEWQMWSVPWLSSQMNWYTSTIGAPSAAFYGMGGATYFAPTDTSSVDKLFASLPASIDNTASSVTAFTALARYYGLKNTAYEGGPALSGDPGTTAATVTLAASRDPRMTSVIQNAYNEFYSRGLDLGLYYKATFGIWTPQNQWNAAEQSQADNPMASPKYAGLRGELAASPVAVSTGHTVSSTGTTELAASLDDVGQDSYRPQTGTTNIWVLNAASAGVYRLSLTNEIRADNDGISTIQVMLNDRTVLGTYQVKPGATVDLGSITLPAGYSTLGIRNVHAFNDAARSSNVWYGAYLVKSLTLTPTVANPTPTLTPTDPTPSPNDGIPAPSDPSFEAVVLPSNTFKATPTGSAWTFDSNSGLATNGSSLTRRNSDAPDGNQVAYLQQTGSISQTFTNWGAGTYTLTVSAAVRAGSSHNKPIQVLVDGKLVGTITPDSTSYETFTTPSFTVTTGSHSVKFLAVNTSNSNDTTFLDAVAVSKATTSTTVTPTIRPTLVTPPTLVPLNPSSPTVPPKPRVTPAVPTAPTAVKLAGPAPALARKPTVLAGPGDKNNDGSPDLD